MKVLLLGCTGNLGLRLLPALLAHGHSVVAYVRNVPKLKSLVHESVIESVTIVVGDATDSPAIEAALLDNDCDAVVNTAGNQVWPWKEHLLQKIARAVTTAAINAGKRRGMPTRAWLIGGIGSLEIPGRGGWKPEDYFPKITLVQHQETANVVQPIPVEDLEWSLLCVARMSPRSTEIVLLKTPPQAHGFITRAGEAPEWKDTWWRYVPLIGGFLDSLTVVVTQYHAKLEDVAAFLAGDLQNRDWIGKFVGYKYAGEKVD